MLAEIFGMLVSQNVPVAEAIVLSADCTADKRLMHRARSVAAAIEQGAKGESLRRDLDDFPPLLVWLIASGASQNTLAAMAHHISDTYRRRVARASLWLRDFLPLWLIVAVGVLVVGAYALSIFLPYSELMSRLGAAGQSLHRLP
jgi:general secretion pathway protein F